MRQRNHWMRCWSLQNNVSAMNRILIVEDELALAQELQYFLVSNQYEAEYLTEFNNVAKQIIAFSPDMVLLDIQLPEADGQ